jgi:HTH-type transcriptional regulator/antitoxin HipB
MTTVVNDARFRTPRELGALIRAVREDHGWSQGVLANRAHVGRQWLSTIENGRRTGAEMGMVLRVLDALEVKIFLRTQPSSELPKTSPAADLDALLDEMTDK